ncbi:hypothetical protein P5F04_16030 [Clostridium perfringens]|nr:hypothetical protein [Clostridium perfringens]
MSTGSTLNSSPVTSVAPAYRESRPSRCRSLRASNRPVQYAAA